MKIVTYNVNGIRAAIKKGLLEWMKNHNFDIVCFQETKAQPDQIDPKIFEKLGYHAYWNSAEKKGYSGVLTLSKTPATFTNCGIGKPMFDREGRVIRTDFADFSLLNCYFPSGSSGEERHNFKMKFLRALNPWVNRFLKENPNTIIVGDYNIVHGDIDIHNPKRRDNPSGFRPEERKWLDLWFKSKFIDAIRSQNPGKELYSWWTYRVGARAKNKGWRIDYISVSNSLSAKIEQADHDFDAYHSDHCPVWVRMMI